MKTRTQQEIQQEVQQLLGQLGQRRAEYALTEKQTLGRLEQIDVELAAMRDHSAKLTPEEMLKRIELLEMKASER
jgi:hypothetical protein